MGHYDSFRSTDVCLRHVRGTRYHSNHKPLTPGISDCFPPTAAPDYNRLELVAPRSHMAHSPRVVSQQSAPWTAAIAGGACLAVRPLTGGPGQAPARPILLMAGEKKQRPVMCPEWLQ